MKRIIIILLVTLLSFSLTTIMIKAVSNDDGSASYSYLSTKSSLNTQYTSYTTDMGTTTYNGDEYSQQVHVFTQKQTENSKVVTWTSSLDNGKLARANIIQTALDYELNHPEWKVIGGINADQYVTGFGTDINSLGKDYYYPQPYYPMICDGEGWFMITGMPVNGGQNIVSFIQGGVQDPLLNGSANLAHGDIAIKGLYLYARDEKNNILGKFEITHFNESPKVDETALWTSYVNEKEIVPIKKIKGNLYVCHNAIRAYANNSIDYTYKENNNYNGFFGKGYIDEIVNESEIGYGDFAIDSNDKYLQSLLKIGTLLTVQYEYAEGYSEVESAIGYHTIHRMDNKDRTISSSNTYNTRQYPRSLVGRTEDGKIVLMAIDGSQAKKGYCGTNFWETNAVLKTYGVVEAYQMDGGGSVSAMVTTDNGDFKWVNSPSDGNPRSVFSALFVVERRDPDALLTIIENNPDNILLSINISDYGAIVEKVVITINNETYETSEKELRITGLKRNFTYDYKIEIMCVDNKSYTLCKQLDINKLEPIFISCRLEIDDDIYKFTPHIEDIDKTISNCYILVDGKVYSIKEGSIIINDLKGIPYLKYDYNIGNSEVTITIKNPSIVYINDLDEMYHTSQKMIDEILK